MEVDNSNSSSDSELELFPTVLQLYDKNFVYNDPLLVSGVLRAVVEGDLIKVNRLLLAKQSPNINDNNGNTPLHVAVINDLPEILDRLLLEDGIVVNTRNFFGETPLFHAVKRNNFQLAEKLLNAGANVNLPNYEDITPLHLAVKNPEFTHLLIKNEANINASDYSGDTPLHEAVNEKCLETVCMLLYYNADANAMCDNNITPFMRSLINEDVEIQHALFEYVDNFNVATNDYMTTLALALTHDTPYVEEIIKRGADVNFENGPLCAFMLCVQYVPSLLNFKLIWPEYNFQENFPQDFLLVIANNENYYINEYLNVIIESNNILPIIESLNFYDSFSRFIHNSIPNIRLKTLTEFTCLLFSHGYLPTYDDLNEVYRSFGYCELFKIMLFMDIRIDYSPTLTDSFSFARVIYDLKMTVNEFTAYLIKCNNYERYALASFLQFFNNSRVMNYLKNETNIAFFDLDNKVIIKLDDNDDFIEIKKMSSVPSLLELARNRTREFIVQKFKFTKCCQYYTYLKFLEVPEVYKKILSFEAVLY